MKFKDLRGFMISCVFMILALYLMITSYVNDEKTMQMYSFIFTFVVVLTGLSQFYNRIMNDCVFIYTFKIVTLLPVIIEFGDIRKIDKKSKNKVVISTKNRNYNVYIFNSDRFIKELNGKMEKQYESN